MDLLPFYVYAFLRPDGTPCYIGKGKGNRWRHDGKYGRNLHLRRIIANAKESGQPLERIKLIENMSEADALSMEAFFIAAVGREAQGGPLVNLTDGGEVGPPIDAVHQHPEFSRQRGLLRHRVHRELGAGRGYQGRGLQSDCLRR